MSVSPTVTSTPPREITGAVLSIARGSVERINRFVRERVIDRICGWPVVGVLCEAIRSKVHFRRVSDDVPGIDDEIRYLRVMSDGCLENYRFVDGMNLEFTPGDPFVAVECGVADVRGLDECTIEANFRSTDGSEITKKATFSNGKFNERAVVPFRFRIDEPAEEVRLSLHTGRAKHARSTTDIASSLPSSSIDRWRRKSDSQPGLTVPAADYARGPDTPIFLISVDTFRYDHLELFDDVIDALGPNARVPEEPRTQGISTWPSHASMFTGVHPGDHGCYSGNFGPKIQESLVTLPELLERNGYTCSGCVAAGNLAPEIGYGRGFHRYELKPMSWETRKFDARSNVNTVIDWVIRDGEYRERSPFYFLHLFDAHYPYVPPLPLTDTNRVDYQAMERLIEHVSYRDYLRLVEEDPLTIDAKSLKLAKEYYRESLSHVATQLGRLVENLKTEGVFEQSLVIVTGDHGEDFYERNFVFHHSLYDANIRPGMIVKPPSGSEMVVPDDPDTIDFLPVIAEMIGCGVPAECEGRPWNDTRERRPRITERLLDMYNVSVEIGGLKGIFTYEQNNPDRPTEAQITDGPLKEEFYVVDPDGEEEREVDGEDATEERKSELRRTAERFIRKRSKGLEEETANVSSSVKKRLEDLGYR